jgi:hypothetical protein
MRCVFQREERCQTIRLKTPLEIGGRSCVDGGRTQEAGGTYPDVEAAVGVEGFVDEGQGVLLRGDAVGVVDDFGVGILL